jgi:hypothetical protein
MSEKLSRKNGERVQQLELQVLDRPSNGGNLVASFQLGRRSWARSTLESFYDGFVLCSYLLAYRRLIYEHVLVRLP